ncbi:MAG: Hsp70 family protein, partial [Vulcanimicrobiaceae bacterium]
AIPQWDAPAVVTDAPTLPSFLYLPHDAEAERFGGSGAGDHAWVAGRLARANAAEFPGRVAHSAKSWLCHHAADRTAPFLPWGSDELAREQKISPVRASVLLLAALRDAWNVRFAERGAEFAFDSQSMTLTVPASFDAAAQRLTLAAAQEAGFPESLRLLEEPQAAFYRWLEQHDPLSELSRLADGAGETNHVLVVDIGGGTSDFSLFAFRPNAERGGSGIERIAVSNHILLGGDNMDLALAHRLEPQLTGADDGLSAGQWAYLVARCRDVKERALSGEGPADEPFSVSIPGRGSGLIAGARSAHLSRSEIEKLLLEGFFPECAADETPLQTKTALGEWGLPYAADPGVTRHLADFLRDRPAVGAVLFNGGALAPRSLRQRISQQIGKWQGSQAPLVLENPEPQFAVARGAARFGRIAHSRAQRIKARSAHAVFLEAHRSLSADAEPKGAPSLVCILPKDADAEETFELGDLALELRINVPVRFRAYSSTRQGATRAGDVVEWNARDFAALPPLETVAKVAEPARAASGETVPVSLSAKLNELGLLAVTCTSEDPAIRQSWPLEFNLRLHDDGKNAAAEALSGSETASQGEPNVSRTALDAARTRIETLFAQPLNKRDKLTATRLIKSLETIFGVPKSEWNVSLLRSLWSTLERYTACRRNSVEHEEAWLILAGFLLRPGFGAALDGERIDRLWQLLESGPAFANRQLKLQEYILWRRVSGGLSSERQERILTAEIDKLRRQESPPPDLVLLAGSLERIGLETKTELVERFIAVASKLVAEERHSAHLLAALGLLLNRSPLYAGPETVVSADLVERAYDAFSKFDWAEPKLVELQTAFLRAARVVNNRTLEVSKSLRERIASKLERSGVPPARTAPLRGYMPMERSDRAGLLGESLPPGLILREG